MQCVRSRFALVAVVVSGFAIGCGSDEPSSTAGAEPAVLDSELAHIHGLGINPADGALIVATHSGLFRAADDQRSPQRVGDRRQDTMGFSVVGPNRFLGSGHPDVRDDLPPLLGLIQSNDAGRSWENVSLLGQADFHVLRTVGTRIYGFDASSGRLLVSDDGGRRWRATTTPAPIADLAPHPNNPDRVVLAGEELLYLSRNAGRQWQPLPGTRPGLLVWPSPRALYAVNSEGSVLRSPDGGRSWQRRGAIGGEPAALASHEADLYVALHSNEVKMSSDGGRTWTVRLRP